MNVFQKILAFFLLSMLAVSCSDDDTNDINSPLVNCDKQLKPVVMVHGLLASGDTYADQFMRFTSNNYCSDRLFVFDWNTLDQSQDAAALLDLFIDDVLLKTGSAQVFLAGHSAGGGVGYNYLSEPARAVKVAGYVHIGSSVQSGPAGATGEVPTLNIWSPDDKVVTGGDINGATNLSLPGQDHYQVATSSETFDAMYRFFNENKAPLTLNIIPQNNIAISGKVVSLGENVPKSAAQISIFELNPATGERLNENPDFTPQVDNKGYWSSVKVKANVPYEFEVNTGDSSDRLIHYYREGFQHSNSLVYLRVLPPPSSFAGNLLAALPSDDEQSVVVIFSASKAVINGRDDLRVNNNELSNAEFASADITTIAFFLFDDGNNTSDFTSANPLFASFPFLEAVDVFFPTQNPSTIRCTFNGRSLNLRNWKSQSEGISIAVFD